MKNTNLLPLVSAQISQFFNADGDLDVLYLQGHPRQYRFDASRGLLNINGETVVSGSGKPFSFAPIAYQMFQASLFNYPPMEWVEFFFINGDNQLCAVLFHGFSVENLKQQLPNLFYERLTPCGVVWSVVPKEKTNAAGNTYYIASFEATPQTDATREAFAELRRVLPPIFRAETALPENVLIASEHYSTLTANVQTLPTVDLADLPTLPFDVADVSPIDDDLSDAAILLDAKNDLAARQFAKRVVGRKVKETELEPA